MEALNNSFGIGQTKNNGCYLDGSRKKITTAPQQPCVFPYSDLWQHSEPLLDVLKSASGDTPLPELGGTYGWSVRYRQQEDYAGLGVNTLADYIDAFRQGDIKLPYLRHISLNRTAQSIRQYIKDPVAFSPNWVTSPWLDRWGGPEIFIGQAGTTFGHVHRDHVNVHVGFVQLQGEKELILFPPDDEPYVYACQGREFPYQDRATHVRYVDLQDYEQFPLLRKASPRRIVLRAGQALLMPANWWHTTYNHSDSVSYSIRIVNATNIAGCIGEHFAGVPRLFRKLMGSE
ncbi:MAG: cupin-like domain-containing protein [Gammaproteobacteria bacterium]